MIKFVILKKKYSIFFFIAIFLILDLNNAAFSQFNDNIVERVINEDLSKDTNIIERVINDDLSKDTTNSIDNIINTHQLIDKKIPDNINKSTINDIIEKKQYALSTGNIHINTKIEKAIPLKKKKFIIIIDPGHGGIDPGTIGVHYKTYEKTLTLEYAKLLQKKLLNKQYIVYLTRDNDKFISLNARRNLAKKYKGDLFISLHFNYSDNYNTRGASVYTLSEKSYNNDAKLLSERENKVDILGNEELTKDSFGLADLLIDMIRRNTNNSSVKFAKTLISVLAPNIMIIDNAHRFAGFRVLKGFKTPAVLIEVGYLSNKNEEIMVKTKDFKEKFTELLSQSIDKYFDNK